MHGGEQSHRDVSRISTENTNPLLDRDGSHARLGSRSRSPEMFIDESITRVIPLNHENRHINTG